MTLRGEQNMNMSEIPGLHYIPEKYRGLVMLGAFASPFISRACHALYSGRGIKGVICGIWLGTNTPKKDTNEQS